MHPLCVQELPSCAGSCVSMQCQYTQVAACISNCSMHAVIATAAATMQDAIWRLDNDLGGLCADREHVYTCTHSDSMTYCVAVRSTVTAVS